MALSVRGSDSLYWGTGIDTTGLQQGAAKSKGILATLAQQITAMDVFAAISASAVYHFQKAAKEAILLGARMETLQVVLQVVGNTAGYTGAEMEELAKSLEKTGISMIGSRQMIVRMIQSQIDLKDATKLARVAQDAAVIGNINSTDAFEKLIHGIQTGEPRILRHIGIIVDFEAAYQRAAKAQGTNSDALSQMEKAQIRANEVLRVGEAIQGAYSAAMTTAGKLILSMQRYVEDLKVLLGQAFGPALSTAIIGISDKMKELNETLSSEGGQNAIREWGEAFNLTLIEIQADFVRIGATIDHVGLALMKAYRVINTVRNFGIVGELTPGRQQLTKDINVIINELDAQISDKLKTLDGLAEKYVRLQDEASPEGRAAKDKVSQQVEAERIVKSAAAKAAEALDAAIIAAEEANAAANEAWLERYSFLQDIVADGEKGLTDEQDAAAEERIRAMHFTNAERLNQDIAALEERLVIVKQWGDQYKGEVERIEGEITKTKAELSDLSTDKNKKTLSEILKDTRKFNDDKLEAYKKSIEEQAKLAKGNVALEIALNKELSDVIDELARREIARLQHVTDSLNALADLISTVDPSTGKKIGEVATLFSQIGTVATSTDPFAKVAAGLGAIKTSLGLLKSGMDSLTGGGNEPHQSKYIQQLEIQNGLIERQIDLQRSLNGSEAQKSMEAVVALQKMKILLIEEEIARIQELNIRSQRGDYGGIGITRSGAGGTTIVTSTPELTDAKALLAEYKRLADEGITSTTAESISAGIIQGFRDGKKSAADFSDDFQDMMEDAVLESISRSLTTDLVNNWLESFAASMEGGLTEDEIDDLRSAYNLIIESGKTAFEAFEQISGGPAGSTTDTKGIAGAISGITEKTAGLLEAQFNAMRMNTVRLLGYADSGLAVNTKIRDVLVHRNEQAAYDTARIATIRDNSYYIIDTYRKTAETVRVLNDILIVNSRTADNTELLSHLVSIDKKLSSKALAGGATPSWERVAGI